MSDKNLSRLLAHKSVLEDVLKRLSLEQLRDLYDNETSRLQIRESSRTTSDSDTHYVNELRRIIFHVAYQIHLMETLQDRNRSHLGVLHLYCIRCDMPVAHFGYRVRPLCPICDSAEFIERLR